MTEKAPAPKMSELLDVAAEGCEQAHNNARHGSEVALAMVAQEVLKSLASFYRQRGE